MPGVRVSPRDGAELDNEDAPAQNGNNVKSHVITDDLEEDLADYYIRTTHWTKQTLLSTQQAIKSVWKRLVQVRGTADTKEALKSYWTTLGVVSALLLSVSYSTAITPLRSDDPSKEAAASFVTIVGGLSLMISLLIIVITVIYLIEIDNCTTEKDLQDFIRNNGSLFDILTGIFSASVVLLGAGALASMYVTYTRMEFLVVAIATGVLACMCAAFAAVIAGHNRFRMWARYDSPKALQRAKAAAAAGGDKAAGDGGEALQQRKNTHSRVL